MSRLRATITPSATLSSTATTTMATSKRSASPLITLVSAKELSASLALRMTSSVSTLSTAWNAGQPLSAISFKASLLFSPSPRSV